MRNEGVTPATALWAGILAVVLPPLALLLVDLLDLGKDYGALLVGATVVLAGLYGIVTGVQAVRENRHWQATVGLVLSVLATAVHVVGGLGFLFLLWSVLRHD